MTVCTFNGGYMGLELRETENVTITNNTFNEVGRHILLPVNSGCSYKGTITITGNISNKATSFTEPFTKRKKNAKTALSRFFSPFYNASDKVSESGTTLQEIALMN